MPKILVPCTYHNHWWCLASCSNLCTRSYDPGYFNTAVCKSKITYIDGDKGILEYRGYPIEQLAQKSTFLEVSFLLIYGYLPKQVLSLRQLGHWQIESWLCLPPHRTNLISGLSGSWCTLSFMRTLWSWWKTFVMTHIQWACSSAP